MEASEFKSKLIVYISGPISKGDLQHNVNQSTEAFVKLLKAGFSPINPMWSVYCKPVYLEGDRVLCEATRSGGSDIAHSDWLAVDLTQVAVSDIVLRLPGDSVGADTECGLAEQMDIPIYYDIDQLIESFKEVGNI